MTKYNSSKYRVEPLMDEIKDDLGKLNKILNLININISSQPYECWYGNNEKLLKPDKKILIKLIDYIRTKDSSLLDDKKSRHLIYHGNSEERDFETKRAKELLEKNYNNLSANSKDWYIFEGFTHPDIFMEGDDYVIVCEGKWTERNITTYTSNLKKKDNEYRCQMIRHIQATLNYTDKKVFAFYIVDEKCGYLEDLTKDALRKQLERETIQDDENNKENILNSFYGYITWQQAKEVLPSIKFLSKRDIDNLN